jgi:hypothetical protein
MHARPDARKRGVTAPWQQSVPLLFAGCALVEFNDVYDAARACLSLAVATMCRRPPGPRRACGHAGMGPPGPENARYVHLGTSARRRHALMRPTVIGRDARSPEGAQVGRRGLEARPRGDEVGAEAERDTSPDRHQRQGGATRADSSLFATADSLPTAPGAGRRRPRR